MSTIKVDTIVDEAGTGAPNFSAGATVTGNITATGTIGATGTVTGGAFSGSGAGLTGIPTSAITGLAAAIPAPFAPVAVTGTTPSLNVGSYNYFDNGTLTANTTVSFASVPTNARWTYTFKGGLVGGYVAANATYDNVFYSPTSQTAAPTGVDFKTDGTVMYICGAQYANIWQYSLSTPWVISTATYVSTFSVSPQETGPQDVTFKTDGTEMYVVGDTGNDIGQYTLSTAWDITTASYTRALNVEPELTPTGMSFSTNGLYIYLVGSNKDVVRQFTLSTAWNIGTASLTRSYDTSGYENTPHAVALSPDGLQMFVIGAQTHYINQWTLSTAYDISTASFTVRTDLTSTSPDPTGLRFSVDGSKMYIADNTADKIFQFSTATTTTLTLPASVSRPPTGALSVGTDVTYEFVTLDGGTTVKLIGEEIV